MWKAWKIETSPINPFDGQAFNHALNFSHCLHKVHPPPSKLLLHRQCVGCRTYVWYTSLNKYWTYFDMCAQNREIRRLHHHHHHQHSFRRPLPFRNKFRQSRRHFTARIATILDVRPRGCSIPSSASQKSGPTNHQMANLTEFRWARARGGIVNHFRYCS